MLYRKASHAMTNERFAVWFENFKKPYGQTKFIYSYKALENPYSELVIRHLLNFRQRAKVNRFIAALPKMSNRRFRNLLKKLKQDSTVLYQYSAKDFTRRQHLLIRFYLVRNYLRNEFFKAPF